MDTNLYKDFIDESANLDFQQLFYSKYDESNLDFLPGSFQNCLKEVVDQRKPLIFFLHNENSEYSRKCCKLLTEKEIEGLICEHFLILGWKINNWDENFVKDLADRILIVEEVIPYIKTGSPCIFTIIPNLNSVKTYKSVKIDNESMSKDGWLLSNLKDIRKLMSLYVDGDYFQNMTSSKYQQMVFEEFKDRDYESFENDQHNDLIEKILYAMYGPGGEINGKIDYKEEQIKQGKTLYEKIRSKNNEYSKWDDKIVISFIYNCLEPLAEEKQAKENLDKDYKPEVCPVPVFILRKCKRKKEKKEGPERKTKPCRIFIDNVGRVYDNWEKYLENNVLPPKKMIFPAEAKYQGEPSDPDTVWLKEEYTPSCSKTTRLLKVADIGSGITGFLSGATFVAAMFTPLAVVALPAAVVAGTAVGAYATGRGTGTLVDRGKHEQSISVTNSESRGAYLSIAAGTFGAMGAGATNLLTGLVRDGVNVGKGTIYAVNAINGVNIAISGTATVNSCYDVYQQYIEEKQMPSTLTLLQIGSSLFFFGNSIYNFRTAGTIINEVQSSTLNEINDALRSNRHRKTFNKLLKESTRVQGNTKGKAEVIATMRNTNTRDDVLAILTRSNKNFNKNGIRFTAEGGGISLNGVKVDILEYGNMARLQQNLHLETLPPIPENLTPNSLNRTETIIKNMSFNENITSIFRVAGGLESTSTIVEILAHFKSNIQQEIIRICERFMRQIDVISILKLQTLLDGDIKTRIIEYIGKFIYGHAIELKSNFESRLLVENVINICNEFGFKNHHVLISDFMDYIIKRFEIDNMMDELVCEFQIWLAGLIDDDEKKIERKEKRHQGREKDKKDCPVCGGYYYVTK